MNLNIAYLESIEKELAKLPPLYRLAFAASCCERLLPNYKAFVREEGLVESSIPRIALDEVWQILHGKYINITQVQQLREDCETIMPDFDCLTDGTYSYVALQCTEAICRSLDDCIKSSLSNTLKVVEYVINTVNEHIRSLKDDADPEWDKKDYIEQESEIENHPFVGREIAKQKEDLQKLKDAKTLEPELLEWLHTTSHNNGKSLIDLS